MVNALIPGTGTAPTRTAQCYCKYLILAVRKAAALLLMKM
jgi:hypothetical protein